MQITPLVEPLTKTKTKTKNKKQNKKQKKNVLKLPYLFGDAPLRLTEIRKTSLTLTHAPLCAGLRQQYRRLSYNPDNIVKFREILLKYDCPNIILQDYHGRNIRTDILKSTLVHQKIADHHHS